MENPEPRAQYLNVVLRHIERTSLRIPRFQRHFVWGERDILELLESIENSYPIGSILTWRIASTDDYFSGFRERPFPPADETINSFEVILDGAQRLSSLYGCLRDPSSDSTYQVFYDLRGQEFVHGSELRSAPDRWLVPMDTLFDSRRFLEVQSGLGELDDADDLLRRAVDLFSTFQNYQIPIIALTSEKLDDVVEVFRRVNSSGTPLSSVDFVRALTWRSSFDLEETFEVSTERYAGTALDGLTEEFLVRCLAVSAGLSLDPRDVLKLKDLARRSEALDEELKAMTEALDRMAGFLPELRITSASEIPYEVQRLILFAIMLYAPDTSKNELADWFWKSTLAEEHQSKPESYITQKVGQIRRGNVVSALEVKKPVEGDVFIRRARRAGTAVATGFDLLLRVRDARSLLSGEPVAGRELVHANLFLSHDFPAWSEEVRDFPTRRSLANSVILTPDDAAQWKRLQRLGGVQELFDECEARTGTAREIWATQGIDLADGGLIEILLNRSYRLRASVLPHEE